MRNSLLLAAVVLSMAASALADPPVPTMHADTRVVEIDVMVRDSHGKLVEDLRQSDFTITDNGTPRPFTIFSANRAAVARGEPIRRVRKQKSRQLRPHFRLTYLPILARRRASRKAIRRLSCWTASAPVWTLPCGRVRA